MKGQKISKSITVALLISLALLTICVPACVQGKSYSFTATILPSEIEVNQLSTYWVNITNTGDNTLGSTNIAIAQGFMIISPITILNPVSTWNYTLSTTEINLTATVGGAVIQQGQSLIFTFNATAPDSPGVTAWTVEATTSLKGGGVKLTLEGEQPTVKVTLPYIAPTILASPGIIDQNQFSLLSQLEEPSGGTPPYTYKWLKAYNGGTFSPIIGAYEPTYTFSPTTLTATGIWNFKLNVTDSSSVPVTTTSNTVNVIVNPELVAPQILATPNTINQTGTSTLTSNPVTTGTSPYTYQWFQKAPGGSYTTVGGNSPSLTFSDSTTVGTWTFLLQVTDNTGYSINSTAVEIRLTSTPVFIITVIQTAHGTINPQTTTVSSGENQTFIISPDVGCNIADVSVDGISVGAVTSYTFIHVVANHNITAEFTDSSDYYFIDVTSPLGSPTPSAQVNPGDSFTASVTSPDGNSSHRMVCTGYSIDGGAPISGTSHTFIEVQANHTIKFHWQEQYHLTVISPEGSTTGAGWYSPGATVTVSIPNNIITSDTGVRQIFTGWTGDATGTDTTSNPITLDTPKTVTATWKTEYQVTYATSGNLLQVAAPPPEWVDQETQAKGVFPTSVINSEGNTRIIFVGDDRPTAITEPITVTGTYRTQFLVTFIQNGIALDASGTIVTILGETKTYEQLPNSVWINAGSSIDFNYTATIESTEKGKQYILVDTNFSSLLTINEPTTIQGYYEPQTNPSNLNLSNIALIAILLSVPPSLTIPLLVRRRKRKKRITPIANEGGSISPRKVQTIERGNDSTVFIITADTGYKIEDVIIDNTVHLGPIRTYKFVNVTRNHTISATFSKE